MGDSAYNLLPIVLVSAKDNVAASHIITEIIDNDATDTYREKEGDIVQDRVWRIVNKYYTADVRMHGCGDEQLPAGDDPVDAHIIYLQEDEGGVPACARRVVPGGDVRLLLAAGAAPAAAAPVVAWARKLRYELVPLADAAADAEDADDDDDDDDDADDVGVGRVRAALHAHAWRGLRRTDRRAPPAPRDAESDESSESGGSEAGVERAELFARALGALPAAGGAARAGAGAAGGDGDRALRLARAEALLAEFCRALGHDLDSC